MAKILGPSAYAREECIPKTRRLKKTFDFLDGSAKLRKVKALLEHPTDIALTARPPASLLQD